MLNKLSFSLVLGAASIASNHAFSITSNNAARLVSKRAPSTITFMSDMEGDYPSDTSSEEMIDVESEEITPTPSEAIISSILDDLPIDSSFSTDKETRAKINEALLKLERMNPTESPASSYLLNGVWKLKYAGGYDSEWALNSPTRQIALFLYSGGYSPGIFALSLASSLPTSLVEVGDLSIGT